MSMRRGLALLLTATLALSMTACGGSKGAGTQKSEKGDGMTYAVEAGSAGEAVAKEKGDSGEAEGQGLLGRPCPILLLISGQGII